MSCFVLCFVEQLISSQLDPDYVIHTILDRFGVLNVLTFGHETNRLQRFLPPYREKEHELPMLENAIAFLCLLLNNKANLGTFFFQLLALEIFRAKSLLVIGGHCANQVSITRKL
jgi:hypothetical protein